MDAPAVPQAPKPRLVLFYSRTSGPSRRAQGYLAQVLQRRRNHRTFAIDLVPAEDRPDLFERFRIEAEPALVVVEGGAVRGRLQPVRNAKDVEAFLAPWLH